MTAAETTAAVTKTTSTHREVDYYNLTENDENKY